MGQHSTVGMAVELWGYPIKSMQGEEINGAVLTRRGILGGRSYAVRERATKHIASAKHPAKWGCLCCPTPAGATPAAGVDYPAGWNRYIWNCCAVIVELDKKRGLYLTINVVMPHFI